MEMLYQYIWKHRMLGSRIQTTKGGDVEVLNPGRHNHDAGPDFTGARLRIDGQEWSGCVEVHVKASDWFRHHHDSDPAYGNVILHLVGTDDAEVPDGTGGSLPQAVASFPESFAKLYMRLAERIADRPCESELSLIHPLVVTDWMSTLAIERMQSKASHILEINKALGGDWEWTCFATLARALGFGLNSDPLEMLARATPLKILAKHSDDLRQLEALLLGQAGLLDTSVNILDEEYQSLCREYFFLARKYGLRPMRSDIWKLARTRPGNFPQRRIRQLAGTVLGGFSMLAKITSKTCGPEEAKEAIRLDLSAPQQDLMLINFVAPLKYAYGAAHGDPECAEKGFGIWETLKPENNRYLRSWLQAGLTCSCAADSQGLLQLSKEYCDRSRCLECRFGHALLRNKFSNKF